MITEKRLDAPFFKRSLYLEQLRNVCIFSHLCEEELDELLKRMTVRRWHGGSIIFGQNEPGEALFVLVSGRAKVVLFGENGREMTLSVLGPGDFFGEMSLLNGRPRSANILALEDSLLLVLEREGFKAHLAEHPQTVMALLRVMADRMYRANEMINNLALHDVASRLTRILIGMAEESGEVRNDGILIRRRPTQQDLANMVGTCRETVSRTLSSLARRGLVTSCGRSLLLSRALVDGERQAA